jgi:hypothetical protein
MNSICGVLPEEETLFLPLELDVFNITLQKNSVLLSDRYTVSNKPI